MDCLEAVVEVVGPTVGAAVKAHPARCPRPGGLGERLPQHAVKPCRDRAEPADGERLPVREVTAVGELAQRVRERCLVGKIGERERSGQHSCELRRMIMQPSPPQRDARLDFLGHPRVPVQEVAQREQVAQIDRWRESLAGERGLKLPIEQRVDPALGGQQLAPVGDAHHVGPIEVRSAQCLLAAAPAA